MGDLDHRDLRHLVHLQSPGSAREGPLGFAHQTVHDFELLIDDDGSGPETAATRRTRTESGLERHAATNHERQEVANNER
jgi:hypothetical protein